ncbi:MAG: HAD-IC family P-type ATPase [Chitinophagales bacterium]
MKTPTSGQTLLSAFIAVCLCLFPFLPITILQQPTLHLLLCLPLVIWGIYYLTGSWYITSNRKTLHNNILWLIALLILLGLGITKYIAGSQETSYLWQGIAVLTSISLGSLYLLEQLKKRAFGHESHLTNLHTILFSTSTTQTNITVYAGNLIPIDGIVVGGTGLVNESIITGNNMLQDKYKGQQVWAGSELELGQLQVESANIFSNEDSPTFLTQSLEQIKNLKKNLPVEDSAMRYFNNALIIAVLLLAAILAYGRYQTLISITPALPSLQIWTESLLFFATILLVTCPIALAVAVPLAYRQVIDILFKKGIRLKNSSLIKKIAALKHIIFSKTGVLTTGIFQIKNFHSTIPSNDFKSILLALEQHSEHPYAKAVLNHFEGDVLPLELSDIRLVNGLGIMGKDTEGNTYMAGAYNVAAEFTKEDFHSIYVLVNNKLVGWLDLKDRLREEAEPCVTALVNKQLKVSLLSGDRAIPTQYIARKTGIKDYYFQQLPKQKRAIIQQIQVEGLAGIITEQTTTDDLLSQAVVGIELESLPACNNSTPQKTDVAIFHHRLLLVNEMITMCKSLVNRLRWIIVSAIIYNIFAVVLASFGYFSLILAAISSFIVWSITFLLLKI